MQIAEGSGRIALVRTSEVKCPYCKVSQKRYDLEFQVLSLEKEQPVDSSYTIRNVCAHCFTVCDEPPKMDFFCAKCGQLTAYLEEKTDVEMGLLEKVFCQSKDYRFHDFYEKLLSDGLHKGKRYCLACVYKIWNLYLASPDSLREEIEKPKRDYPFKPSKLNEDDLER